MLNFMDNTEIQRRVIGLLTLAYSTDWDPEHGFDPEPVEAAIKSLLDGWGGYDISFDICADYAVSARNAIETSMDGIRQDVTGILAGFISTFTMFCHEVKAAHPDVDVEEILRKMGIDAADSD